MTDPMVPEPQDEPDEPDDTEAEGIDAGATPALRPVKGESVGAAVGSFMAGIEQQVFQRRPPAVELVQEVQPVRGTTGDGLEITLHIPDLPADPGPRER